MPVFRLPQEHFFPPPSLSESNGLLAIGGDLHPQRLILAYMSGVFPWYSEGQPILWFSPDPRYVLDPKRFHVGRSLKKKLKKNEFRVTLDSAFEDVIDNCAKKKRPMQYGTWITADMRQAYLTLHEMGYAHSVEVWREGMLVGGLYGVNVGNLFSGESMFAHQSDASKIGFVWLMSQMMSWGIELCDCQVYTDHLKRFGAENIPRDQYLRGIVELVRRDRPPGKWVFDEGFHPLSRLRL